jgi:hypothetical protein
MEDTTVTPIAKADGEATVAGGADASQATKARKPGGK